MKYFKQKIKDVVDFLLFSFRFFLVSDGGEMGSMYVLGRMELPGASSVNARKAINANTNAKIEVYALAA